jgi:predicted CoA-binding protein
MNEMKKNISFGASANPSRYSYLALQRLRNYGHPVVAIGKRPGSVKDVEIETEKKKFEKYRYGNPLSEPCTTERIL